MTESFAQLVEESLATNDMRQGTILKGKIVDIRNDAVVVNAGNAPSEATPWTMKFYNAYAAKWGVAPEGLGASSSYMAVYVLKDAIERAGGKLTDVIRTRIMLSDIDRWQEAARAHGEFFGEIRPASTFVEVSRFIDPDWLVEVEADGVVGP